MIFSSKNPPIGYYIYLYLRDDGTAYYVGKGLNRRAWSKGKGEVYPPVDKSKIYIVSHRLSENEAFILEKKLIKLYGRKDNNTGILRNKSDGGEGPSGRIQSLIEKARRSASLTGLTKSVTHRVNLSKAHSGKTLTTKHKDKISVAGKERFKDGTEQAKMSIKMTGAGNTNAVAWELTSPDGVRFCVVGLEEFSRENNVPRDRIRLSQRGWKSVNLGKKKNLINKE